MKVTKISRYKNGNIRVWVTEDKKKAKRFLFGPAWKDSSDTRLGEVAIEEYMKGR
jgi:hypothetical protein